MDSMNLVFSANKLREARAKVIVSQVDLASAAGVKGGGNAISRLENGHDKNPSGRTVVALARALGINPADLYEAPQP